MKILAFGASTSSKSINRQFANHVAGQIPDAETTDLDLRDFTLPLFSEDEEEANGVPADARRFLQLVRDHDALVVSLAEHNGSYAAAFKNLYDWASRAEYEVWGGKPMLLLSTSPGARGGASVMDTAKATFPRMGANLKATFSLPSFHDNFSADSGVTPADLAAGLQEAIDAFRAG